MRTSAARALTFLTVAGSRYLASASCLAPTAFFPWTQQGTPNNGSNASAGSESGSQDPDPSEPLRASLRQDMLLRGPGHNLFAPLCSAAHAVFSVPGETETETETETEFLVVAVFGSPGSLLVQMGVPVEGGNNTSVFGPSGEVAAHSVVSAQGGISARVLQTFDTLSASDVAHFTIDGALYLLNPEPYTLNHKPYDLNPEPSTLNPET